MVPAVAELRDGSPAEVVLENARRKARAGAQLAGAREGTLVLGVDTDVALDGRLLGKADDERGAGERLELLSGGTHEVLSGVAILSGARLPHSGSKAPNPGRTEERIAVARSYVTFGQLDRATVDLYLASGEWRDRAGAYAIQGLGSLLVDSIRGDFSNVVGLPIRTLLELAPELYRPPG